MLKGVFNPLACPISPSEILIFGGRTKDKAHINGKVRILDTNCLQMSVKFAGVTLKKR